MKMAIWSFIIITVQTIFLGICVNDPSVTRDTCFVFAFGFATANIISGIICINSGVIK